MHDIIPSRSRILFFRQGAFSYTNDRLTRSLAQEFSDLDIVEIDILRDVVKPLSSVVFRGAAAAALTYLPRILAGDHNYYNLFFRTPFIFNAIRRIIATKYAPLARTALFSIQTQSLYDASIDGLPHFLYTDHTHLANLNYPGANTSQLAARSWIKLESSIYHRVRKNLVMSGFVRDSLTNDYSCDRSRVSVVGASPNLTPNGAPLNNADYTNRTILFIGIDWERKGGPILLSAFRKVLDRIPDARLIIVGASPRVDLPNVEILGRLPLAEIPPLILRSSLFAFPSLREPYGIAAIEALMHGIPVVATNIGALPEIVEDGVSGRIIPPGDVNALAETLISLISDPALLRRYGAAGQQSARARFSQDIVTRRLGDAIRSSLPASASLPAITTAG